MKPINLGNVCAACFDAVNFSPSEMGEARAIAAVRAGQALSKAVADNVRSLHTGELQGFSHAPCAGCGNVLAGERWELLGLVDGREAS